MAREAVIFMAVIWTCLFSLLGGPYSRALRGRPHPDPDGIGPASPAEAGGAERASVDR